MTTKKARTPEEKAARAVIARIRYKARIQGLTVKKSSRMNTQAPDYNQWTLTNPDGETLAVLKNATATEAWLDGDRS